MARMELLSLSSTGWGQFPGRKGFSYIEYEFHFDGITQYSPSILTGGFSTYRGLRTINNDDNTVYLDWFNLPAGGHYFNMWVAPNRGSALVSFRGVHYYAPNHYVDISLFITDRNSKSDHTPGVYSMHCYISGNDGRCYYVLAYFDNDGDVTFEHCF